MINVYIQSSKQSLNKERNEKPQFYNPKYYHNYKLIPIFAAKPINVKYKTTSNHIYIMKSNT